MKIELERKKLTYFVVPVALLALLLGVSPASADSTILGTTGNNPFGIIADSAGNIYVSNAASNNVSKITPAGVSSILGTTGNSPRGIAIDSDGNIYTANEASNNVSKIRPDGVSSILGTTGSGPYGITIDNAGNIYTANARSNNVSKIRPDGVSSILGTTGSGPYGITIDSAGNIYTANDSSGNVSKITPAGVSSILGTTGSGPSAITIDSAGNIYTANYFSFNVSKITPDGVSSILGTTGTRPSAITIDSAGNIYTANYRSHDVSKITPDGVSSILGTTGTNPQSITIDSAGNIYTANFTSRDVSKIAVLTAPPSSESENQAAALAAQKAIDEAKRQAEKRAARDEITNLIKTYKDVALELFTKAEIYGVTAANIAAVQAEISAIPQSSRADLIEVIKIARKYEVVGKIASDQFSSIHSDSLIEIGLIPEDSKHKATLTAAIKKLAPSDRSSYASIKKAIDAEIADIKARKDRLANVIARNASRYSK